MLLESARRASYGVEVGASGPLVPLAATTIKSPIITAKMTVPTTLAERKALSIVPLVVTASTGSVWPITFGYMRGWSENTAIHVTRMNTALFAKILAVFGHR